VTQRRFQFFLADLGAIIALCGLGAALVLALAGRASIGVVYFLICAVVIVWGTFRWKRKARSCQECGRRFTPLRKKSTRHSCPRCGHSQLPLTQSDKALAVGFRSVLGLISGAAVLLVVLTNGVGGPGGLIPSWDALALAVPNVVMLLIGLLLVLLIARVAPSAAPDTPIRCENCGCLIPPPTAELVICPRCRLRDLPREQVRNQEVIGFGIIIGVLLFGGFLAGLMLTAFAGSDSGLSYWVSIPLGIAATVVGIPVIIVVVLLLHQVVRYKCLQDE
jgi:predicted RNA-binding Zn-ribbon protein involved in translation (DUF1610 family)